MISDSRFFFLLLLALQLHAHGQPIQPPDWQVSLSTLLARDTQTPFWLHANRHGLFRPDENTVAVNVGIHAPAFDSQSGHRFHVDYGLQLYGRTGSSSDLWLQEAYLGVAYRNLLRIRAGRWEETLGSRLPDISSGSVIWSGNARPLSRIEMGTPDYIAVPYTRGYAEIKGRLSHGWFDDDRYASDVWLHHKNAFIRMGGDLPVNLWYGLNHFAQWGGSSPRHEEPYPADFESFLRVFFIRSASASHPGSPAGWVENKIGNHLASRNHGIDIAFKSFDAGVFLQDFIEDGSGWRRQNFPDGLWAAWISFREENRILKAITYEYLQSTDQSGPTHNDPDGNIIGGNDNYFNHGVYQSGWSYHQFTIGTPLITSPILNQPPFHRFENTRVRAHHLGIKGLLFYNINYRTLITYSRNFGTYNSPYSPARKQLSVLLDFIGPLPVKGLNAGVSVGIDNGNMYGNNLGLMFRLSYGGHLFGQSL